MTPAANSTPIISCDEKMTLRRVGMATATISATQNPTNIAAPPP